MADATEVLTFSAPVMLAHPALLEPKKFGTKGKETGEPKYSANLVFAPDHPDFPALKDACVKLAKAKWPGLNIGEAVKTRALTMPFNSGTVLADRRKAKLAALGKAESDGEYQRGKIVLVARSKFPVKLSILHGGRIVDLDSEELRKLHGGKFFFGAECLAQVTIATHDGVGNNPPGVHAFLNMVLATGKGTRLAGGPTGSEVFKGYVGGMSAEDPTGGVSDDEIPF